MSSRELPAVGWAGDGTQTCWMCGVRLRVDHLVPDGGSACPDVRWYCRDTFGCTQRWTARLGDDAIDATAGAVGPPARAGR